MTLWNVFGQLVDDQQEGVHIPENATRVNTYRNQPQYGDQEFAWEPENRFFSGNIQSNSPGYLTGMFGRLDRQRTGQLQPWEADELAQWEATARAMPTRDIASLTSGWQGELQGQWGEGGWQEGSQDWWNRLDPGSPDAGPIILALRDKLDAGTATPHERQLYQQTMALASDWDYRATVPQASDAFNPLGDQFFSALGILGLGASGGLAAAPLAAGGASLATTLGSLGTLSGVGGTGLGVIGSALEEPWLQQLGLGLGAAGGIAGGVGGLANLWGTGVNSLRDAARLAQSAGRITGGLGAASGVPGLQQAGRYLGQAGQLGTLGAGAADWLGWGGTSSPLAANVAPSFAPGGVQNLLSAADVATQRGGGGMSEFDWLDFEDPGGSLYAGGSPSFNEGSAWNTFTGWGEPNRDLPWNNPMPADTAGGGGVWGTLGSLASGAGRLLFGSGGGGGQAGIGGPLLSALGSLGGGAIGSNAANEAARLQAATANRALSLQEAQWLQNLERQEPWLQAGQQALPQLQQLAAQGTPAPFAGGNQVQRNWYDYGIPSATPGWTPQTMDANAYRWTPGQGPQAANYRYTPGQTPDAGAYASGPPQLYQGAMPGTQVPTLTGQQVLDQDPGAAFRQTEARRALESSAAARGGLLSGSTLQALQARSQDLASQEYQSAWQRMMARDTEQYGRNWGQYQQNWNQGVQGTQLGLQTNAQNFGQAMSAAQLREQVNQVASQQGWSQAQAESVFREQMAQQASQQGWSQALQGQQWNQGQSQAYDQQRYQQMMQQNQLMYGRDFAENQSNYERELARYNSQVQNQNTQWNRFAGLAGVGQTSVGQLATGGQANAQQQASILSQLGNAQAGGATNQANSWMNALQNVGNAGQGYLQNNALLGVLANLNR